MSRRPPDSFASDHPTNSALAAAAVGAAVAVAAVVVGDVAAGVAVAAVAVGDVAAVAVAAQADVCAPCGSRVQARPAAQPISGKDHCH